MTGTETVLLFVGFFGAVGLYNALVYFTTRDRPFLWYAGIMAAMVAVEAVFEPSLIGLPGAPETAPPLSIIRAGVLIAYFGCEAGFAASFLRLRERLPGYARAIFLLFLLNVIGIAAEKPLPDSFIHRALDDAALFALLGVCAAAGWRSAAAGHQDGRYYLLAWAGGLTGVLMSAIAADFSLGRHYLTYAFQVGMAWEAIFLALALASRVRFANIDQVTGVKNRRAFDDALEEQCRAARRAGSDLALIFIDVDDFKRYNDEHGHLAGDALLRRIAYLCAGCCRDRGDVFARYGGDEFAAVLPHIAPDQADDVAQRMRDLVGQTSPVTISVGVACVGADVSMPVQLIARSDEALYRAKAERKGRA